MKTAQCSYQKYIIKYVLNGWKNLMSLLSNPGFVDMLRCQKGCIKFILVIIKMNYYEVITTMGWLNKDPDNEVSP